MKKTPLLFLCLLVLLLSGCAPRYISVLPSGEWGKAPIHKIAIFPVTLGEEQEKQRLTTGRVSPGGAEVIFDQWVSVLKEKGYDVSRLDQEAEPVTPETVSSGWVMDTGNRLRVDTLVGVIPVRFEEREGGAAGVRKPASVAFDLRIYRVSDGVLTWEGRYAETQKTLLEDLGSLPLFLQRRGRWLSAEELVRYGAAELMKEFPEGTRP
jgi:hypothetical protein